MHRPVTQMIDIDMIFRILVFPGFMFILNMILFCDWVERKFEARIQNRVGPLVAGPAGLFQPFADFIKLLLSANWKIILPVAVLSLMLTLALVTWVNPLMM